MAAELDHHWGPRKTPEDVRRAIATEARLFDSKNVPTFKEAVQSVEIGFQHDVKPMFNKCDHFKGPRGK